MWIVINYDFTFDKPWNNYLLLSFPDQCYMYIEKSLRRVNHYISNFFLVNKCQKGMLTVELVSDEMLASSAEITENIEQNMWGSLSRAQNF